MPKGNRQAKGRPRKPSKSTRLNLDDRLVPIARDSLNGTTATIELGLSIVDYLAKQAALGSVEAIALLATFGVEVKIKDVDPIVVCKPSGEVAAWIV